MMARFDYIRATSLEHAIVLLGDMETSSRPLAGGTDVMVALRLEKPPFQRLVDISRLKELKRVELIGDTLLLGAGLTFREAAESELVLRYAPFLAEACLSVGSPQIRNLGTLGGNVANAAACADSLPALVCLDASAHLLSAGGERRMDVTRLVIKPNNTEIIKGELLTHFSFKLPPEGTRSAFIKLGRRKSQSISRLSMAALGRLDERGLIEIMRLTPGAATPRTQRFEAVEELLLGQPYSRELAVLAGQKSAEVMVGITGRRWSTEYKEKAIAALAERALECLFGDGKIA
jgi:CO/xanthine dehydrogenase FAD-binding subunit